MLKSGRYCQPGCNQRYADFWSQGRNQWIASILIAGIAIVAIVGIAYLIMNGISYKTTYTGDSLLRVFPKSESDYTFLQKFETLNIDAQVWGIPANHNVPVYMYAKAGSMHRLEKTLTARNLTFEVLIQNMQKLLDREEKTIAERQSQYSSEEFDFGNYQPYEKIIEWIEKLSDTNPLVNLTSMGKSYEGRDLFLVKISNTTLDHGESHSHPRRRTIRELENEFQENKIDLSIKKGESPQKPVIYINCGIHAREWVAITSCLWMINELTNQTSLLPLNLLDTFDFWFVPVANPDGYVYSWTTDRLWRKNRSQGHRCYGVDLNRNYDVAFNATSRNSCSSGFGGSGPHSEEETKVTVNLLSKNRRRIKAALFIHSFSQLWLSPYGVNSTYPKEYPEMERVMSRAVSALKTRYGTEYQFGSFANILCMYYSVDFFGWLKANNKTADSAAGTAADYCYGKLGIVHSYVVELRDTGLNSFLLPLEEILPTAIETWDGVIAMAAAIKEKIDAF